MKIRSLLLGSVAAAGLATTGFAADLGVVTSLDICDELGLSGLTISSDDNCLQITGGVSMEYNLGDFNDTVPYQTFARTGNTKVYFEDDGVLNSSLDIDAWLQFVATANSDFGPATATIKLLSEDNDAVTPWEILVDKAWVGIGDTTVLMAGKKDSIFNDGDDAPLNYLGLFNSSDVDAGVGFSATAPATGGVVIQVSHNLGNGLVISGGLENLHTGAGPDLVTGAGTIAYAGDGITAHASAAVDNDGDWKVHSGFKGTWDPITIVGAVAADSSGWWNVLGSASATFDMFTLAASGEATAAGEWGVGGSASATVSDGITINLGSRLFVGADANYEVEAGISAAVTETLTLTAAIGAADSTAAGAAGFIYGKAGLAWNPGGGFTASVAGEANTLGGYKGTFKAAKTIK